MLNSIVAVQASLPQAGVATTNAQIFVADATKNINEPNNAFGLPLPTSDFQTHKILEILNLISIF